MANFAVILPAAGQSSRFRDKEKKPFVNLDGRAVWLRTAEHFVTRKDVVQSFIVIDKNDEEMFRRRYQANLAFMNVRIAHGGAERFESVANALAMVPPEVDFVALARSLGVEAHRVAEPEELSERVRESLSGDKPTLFDVPLAR